MQTTGTSTPKEEEETVEEGGRGRRTGVKGRQGGKEKEKKRRDKGR